MAISKIILNGVTQMDVTQDTVASGNLLSGETATGADGNPVVGAYVPASATIQSLNVTPSETQQTFNSSSVDGYKPVTVGAVSSSYVGSGVTRRSSSDMTVSGTTVTAPAGYYENAASITVSSGTVQTDTKTVTASNNPTSLSFTSMRGEPKMFTVRLNASVSSSGSTTYYYIVDITSHGTTTHGNCFRVGSTRQVANITSGYSWSYSGTTLTITSSAASRSASPGAFYSGSYELMYVY